MGVVFAGSVMYVDQTEPSPASDPLDSHYGSVVDEPQLSLNMSVVWLLEFSKNRGFS